MMNSEQSDQPKQNIPKIVFGKIHRRIVMRKLVETFTEHRKNILKKLQDGIPYRPGDKTYKFKGQKAYAIEYMLKYPTKMVKQRDLLHYCDERIKQDTKGAKNGYADNSRQIEYLRKNLLSEYWIEKKIGNELYFIYLPEKIELITNEIQENSKHKNNSFSKKIITKKLRDCGYKCELTGLSTSEGNLAADHWEPKEGGGESVEKNCVILNKILNEKKNKHNPIVWFCESLLTNFLEICKKTGMDLETVKTKLIGFIQEFE